MVKVFSANITEINNFMRRSSLLLFLLCALASLPVLAQAPSFDEMEFEEDSTTASYRPSGKNYVLVKSKRGNSGVNKTPQADAVTSAEITEIVLVYSETEAGDLAEREEANRERWENLLMTYPELFQFSTTYKNVCQCKLRGDAEAFKQTQGFYIYVNGEVPAADPEPARPEPPKAVAAAPKSEPKSEPKPETPAPKSEVVKSEKIADEKKATEEKNAASQQVAANDNTSVKDPEPAPAKEERKTAKREEEEPVKEAASEPVKKPVMQKKAVAAKPRRAKDSKACRIACYEGGDDALDQYFKDNIQLTKKERRKIKKSTALLRLQLNVDGSIKKVMVTGTDEKFNAMITGAANAMNKWNATVKSGVTVKSEVKITLKYDKATKAIKPTDVTVTPKLAPKCKCVSDSELFD